VRDCCPHHQMSAEPTTSEGAATDSAAASSTARVPSASAVPTLAIPTSAVPADASGPDSITLALSLLVPLIIAVYFLFRGAKGGSGRKLVLFGPVGGGKSAVNHQLRYGRMVPTVSSMAVASATFVPVIPSGADGAPPAKPATVVDVPGSGRLRMQLLEEASSASALLCVLDGTQLATQAREAAGMLFEVLSHDPVARRKLPVLVAVNKSDTPGAASPLVARKAIEQEVQRVRLARTTMADTSGRDKTYKGIAEDDGQPFSFDSLDTNVVNFASISATKPELAAVHKLLEGLR